MTETKGCKKCQQKNTNLKQIFLGILGFYMLGCAIYVTAQLFNNLINLFR